jgi:tetratricopeptide (TPR) repeat protein
MKLFRMLAIGIAAFVSVADWCQEGQPSVSEEDKAATQMLSEGTRLIQSRKAIEAIQQFDKVIASYEDRVRNDKAQVFCARTVAETLMYLTEAANAKTGDAKVMSTPNWAYAYYLKAYALLELGRIPEAKSNLERALALSPRNSQFLSELGNLYQRENDWPQALKTYQLAEAAAKQFSPPNSKNSELSRAWRGIGFVYVEQNRLDEAEKMYQQCLELDKNDTTAVNELRYVRNLKAKQSSSASNSESGETIQPKNRQAPSDPVYLNDAVHATFFAASRCRAPNDPPLDVTNIVLAGVAAAKELERRNPGMQPPEVMQTIDARLAKVKATITDQIDKRGCEAPDIRQLVENFKLFSKRPANGATP